MRNIELTDREFRIIQNVKRKGNFDKLNWNKFLLMIAKFYENNGLD